MTVTIHHGDCLEVLATLEPESFHACVTDPPYGIGFMGRAWDRFDQNPVEASWSSKGRNHEATRDPLATTPGGRATDGVGFRQPNPRCGKCGRAIRGRDTAKGFKVCHCEEPERVPMHNRDAQRFQAWAEEWAREVYRVLKPGAHLLAFGGTRTYHRLACAIEDAGFEIRDSILWLYGSGFPKSLDVSKAIDRAAGAERTVIGVKTYGNGETRPRGRDNVHHEGYQRPWRAEDPQRSERLTAPATDAAREWQGWGTALKPACELICVARKPSADVSSAEIHEFTGWDHWCASKSDGEDRIITARALHPEARSYRARIDKNGREVAREDLGAYEPFAVDAVAANVLRHGTGALNINAGRVATLQDEYDRLAEQHARYGDCDYANNNTVFGPFAEKRIRPPHPDGRWPANVAHDGSPEVLDAFARFGESNSVASSGRNGRDDGSVFAFGRAEDQLRGHNDTGTAARFFYTAKADASERIGNHPTVKPVALMEWLVGLVTPPNGRVLDPFAGTGSTLVACDRLGFDGLGIEQDAQTVADAHEKLRRMRARRMIGNAERVPIPAGQLRLDL